MIVILLEEALLSQSVFHAACWPPSLPPSVLQNVGCHTFRLSPLAAAATAPLPPPSLPPLPAVRAATAIPPPNPVALNIRNVRSTNGGRREGEGQWRWRPVGAAAGDLPTLPVEVVVPRWLALGQAGTSPCISVMIKKIQKSCPLNQKVIVST